MVYDDYADIGIFAKWVMDAPEIGERAHPSVGRRCPCTRKGIKLVLLTIIAISQPVFVWTFQIRKRLRISLPQFLEETFQSSEDPMRLRRRFETGIFGLLYLRPAVALFLWEGHLELSDLFFLSASSCFSTVSSDISRSVRSMLSHEVSPVGAPFTA